MQFSLSFQLAWIGVNAKLNPKKAVIDDIVDAKELKKILRTKNNILILFTVNAKDTQNAIKIFNEAALTVKGQATAIFVDCSHGSVWSI